MVVFRETEGKMFNHDEMVVAQEQNYSIKKYLNAEFSLIMQII